MLNPFTKRGNMTEVEDILAGNGGRTLTHHGIKGMRWGVRKSGDTATMTLYHPSGLSRDISFDPKKGRLVKQPDGQHTYMTSDKKEYTKIQAKLDAAKNEMDAHARLSEDHRNASSARSKPLSELSNKELSDMLNRIDLENRYAKVMAKPALPPKNAGVMTKGKKYVTGLLVSIGQHEMQRVARSAASIMVEDRLTGTKRSQKDLLEKVGERIQPKQKKPPKP